MGTPKMNCTDYSAEAKSPAKFDGDGFILASPVKIDGKDYRAFVLIRKDVNGSQMYVHEVYGIEKLPKPSTGANESPSGAAGVIEKVAQDVRSEEMKISAERGEGDRYHQIVELNIAKLETSQAASGSTPTNQSSRSNSATTVSLDD